jgi:proline iminopeptidase
MPANKGYVTAEGGIRLFFRTLGSGEEAVLIPNGFHLFDELSFLADRRTLIFYDLRNRGWSDPVTDGSRLERGIHNDVEDLEAVRRHFGLPSVALLGHSYVGLPLVLYAMKHPSRVERVVQIGPMPPNLATQYPPHLTGADETLRDVFGRLGQMQKERGAEDAEEFCRKFWSVLRLIYVTDPANAEKINWGRCELSNERNFMKYWVGAILPSIQSLDLTGDEMARVEAPVLTIHGTRDRSSPYGAGREWALRLPNARLVTVEGAGHAPWIEAPDEVFASIETFLDGTWPPSAREVKSTQIPPDRRE